MELSAISGDDAVKIATKTLKSLVMHVSAMKPTVISYKIYVLISDSENRAIVVQKLMLEMMNSVEIRKPLKKIPEFAF